MNMNAVHQSTPSHRRRLHKRAVRILTAVPLCDGHDSAIMTINLELVRHGIEVIYLGYHRSVADIVRAALQEDARRGDKLVIAVAGVQGEVSNVTPPPRFDEMVKKYDRDGDGLVAYEEVPEDLLYTY